MGALFITDSRGPGKRSAQARSPANMPARMPAHATTHPPAAWLARPPFSTRANFAPRDFWTASAYERACVCVSPANAGFACFHFDSSIMLARHRSASRRG